MASSVIRRFDNDPQARELAVEFVSGKRYAYSGVSAETVAEMGSAFARGRFFNRHIRDHFPFREISAGTRSPADPPLRQEK